MKLTAGISYSEVKNAYDKEKDARIKLRLLIILKAFKIKSSYKIGEQVNASHVKVQRWINRFNKNGFDGLKDYSKTGRPAYVNDKKKIILKEILDSPKEFSVGWRTLEVLDKIKKRFQIKYTARHVRRLLHKLGYSRVKPRPSNINKDPIKGKIIVEKLKKNSYVWIKNGLSSQKTNLA